MTTTPENRAGRRGRHRHRLTRRGKIVVAALSAVALVVVAAVGYGAYLYLNLDHGLQRSSALAATHKNAVPTTDTNLLVMGLDSRLNAQGKPLPESLYRALHTGNSSIGGFNSNVLIYLHIPANGSRATGFAIPRDDYVDIPGCPMRECRGKIKEAYGLAYYQKQSELARHGITGEAAQQQARDAGRASEIATVEQFLGVRINHFVEVTMVGFFQVAQVVQPITVCLKQATQDTFSGANFVAGKQEINAKQAMAFVRQRRDNVQPDLLFTDLDRSRRQQAFIVSLFLQLKQAGTLLNPVKLTQLVDVAKQNIVVDDGLDPMQLAQLGSQMSGGNIRFYTLPVERFGTDPQGQSINVVDAAQIRAMVHRLLHPQPAPSAKPSPSTSTATRTAQGATQQQAVSATGGGRSGPPPTALTELTGAAGIPCVK